LTHIGIAAAAKDYCAEDTKFDRANAYYVTDT